MIESSNKENQATEQTPNSPPQVTPDRSIGFGHPEYHFVQGLMEVQKHLGEIKASVDALHKTMDSTKSKVDGLVEWKNKIIGGAIVLGVLATVIGYGVKYAVDNLEFKNKTTDSVKAIQNEDKATQTIPEQKTAK